MRFVEDEEAMWKKTPSMKFYQGYAEEDSIYDEI